jgi:hypothetical protein
MNAINVRSFRGFAIATLLAAGVAMIVPAGCGDSDNGWETDDPTLRITAANGEDVASTLVMALGLSFDVGEIPDDGLPVPIAGTPVVKPGSGVPSNLLSKLRTGELMELMSCPNGGTVDISVTVSDPNTLSIGDRIVAVFESCGDLEDVIMSGTLDLTVAAIEGDPFTTDVFLLGLDVQIIDMVMSDNEDIVTANADFSLTLDSLRYPVYEMSLVGDELEFGADDETITMTDFDHFVSFDDNITPTAVTARVSGRLYSSLLRGTVDYLTRSDIEASGDNDPHDGRLRVDGANNTSMRIVIVDATHVTLEIDENGDGVIDEYIDTTWAELTGQTSIINTSTAETVAREAYNAVKGFGSVSVIAGLQFAPNGVFRLIDPLGISGDFGPIEIICPISGTATLSGTKAAADTFTAGDVIDAQYAACARGNGILDGGLVFTVGSFEQATLDAVLVTGIAVETSLRRTVDNCSQGTGTFDAMVDYRFTSPPAILASSSAASFTVAAGGNSQQLSGASVNTQIDMGQSVTTVKRDSSGSFTSEDVDGVMTYRSIVPDEFVFDTSVETGPYVGELLVTASDGSTLRLVAVDDATVRFDVDPDGDAVVDHQVTSTWAELEYSGSLCE